MVLFDLSFLHVKCYLIKNQTGKKKSVLLFFSRLQLQKYKLGPWDWHKIQFR